MDIGRPYPATHTHTQANIPTDICVNGTWAIINNWSEANAKVEKGQLSLVFKSTFALPDALWYQVATSGVDAWKGVMAQVEEQHEQRMRSLSEHQVVVTSEVSALEGSGRKRRRTLPPGTPNSTSGPSAVSGST